MSSLACKNVMKIACKRQTSLADKKIFESTLESSKLRYCSKGYIARYRILLSNKKHLLKNEITI